jgi:hypothetical protein
VGGSGEGEAETVRPASAVVLSVTPTDTNIK